MAITFNQFINLFNQPINQNSNFKYFDVLMLSYPPKKYEEDDEYLQNIFSNFQDNKSLLLIDIHTGEIITEINLQNYNGETFKSINNFRDYELITR